MAPEPDVFFVIFGAGFLCGVALSWLLREDTCPPA